MKTINDNDDNERKREREHKGECKNNNKFEFEEDEELNARIDSILYDALDKWYKEREKDQKASEAAEKTGLARALNAILTLGCLTVSALIVVSIIASLVVAIKWVFSLL